jgi:branched-chain amino acid transport system ATP-binding protein
VIVQAAPALEAIGLTKSFGAFTAVKDVSFSISAREVVAIIGPNGAGKTTLFDLLTGRKQPDSGRIRLFGKDVTGLPPWRRVRLGLGRSFQVSSVFSTMSALENVQIGLLLAKREAWRPFGIATQAHRSEAEALLDQVGLGDRLHLASGKLSHGDQRALELAVALSSRPKLLLLDEPTAGMGVAETEECLERVKAIASSQNIPVLFIEHDMSVVFSFSKRIIVLVAGQVAANGAPEEVRSNAEVREAYFGESL